MAGELFDLHARTGDGSVFSRWRYNDSRSAIVRSSETWSPAALLVRKYQRDLSETEFDIVAYNPGAIQPLPYFIAGNPPSNVWVSIYEDRGADASPFLAMVGKISRVEFRLSNMIATITCLAASRPLLGEVPAPRYTPRCSWILGGVECAVNLNGYMIGFPANAGTWGVDGKTVSHANVALQPDGYFAGGEIRNGLERAYILAHEGDTLTLLNRFRSASDPQYEIRPGCDKTRAACLNKFNNLARFGGYPRIPIADPSKSGL